MAKFRIERDLGNHRYALRYIDRAISMQPDNTAALKERFDLLFDAVYNCTDPADFKSEYFNKCIMTANILLKKLPEEEAPARAYLHNQKGILQSMLGRHKVAQKNFEKALEIDPEYVERYRNLITEQLGKGMYEELEATARQFINRFKKDVLPFLRELFEKNPKDVFCAVMLAEALESNNLHVETKRQYQLLVDRFPEQALPFLKNMHEKNDRDPFYTYQYARALEANDDVRSSNILYREASGLQRKYGGTLKF